MRDIARRVIRVGVCTLALLRTAVFDRNRCTRYTPCQLVQAAARVVGFFVRIYRIDRYRAIRRLLATHCPDRQIGIRSDKTVFVIRRYTAEKIIRIRTAITIG